MQFPGSSGLLFTVMFIFGLAIILYVILIHLLNTWSRITKRSVRVQLGSSRNTVHQRLFDRSRFSPIRSNSLRLQLILNPGLNNEIYMRTYNQLAVNQLVKLSESWFMISLSAGFMPLESPSFHGHIFMFHRFSIIHVDSNEQHWCYWTSECWFSWFVIKFFPIPWDGSFFEENI